MSNQLGIQIINGELFVNGTKYNPNGGGGSTPTPLQGKTVAFLGDSITALGNYPQYFGQLSGATVTKYAVGGATYGAGGTPSNIISLQAANLTGDEDLVIMMAGTNDFGYSHIGVELGDIYDTDANDAIVPTNDGLSTCCGLHSAINAIYAKKSTMPIIIITPPQKGEDTSGGGRYSGWDKNSKGHYLYEYVDAIKKVAQLYGIAVVDQFANIGVNPMIAGMKTKYFNADGTHPNDDYNHLLANWLYASIVEWIGVYIS